MPKSVIDRIKKKAKRIPSRIPERSPSAAAAGVPRLDAGRPDGTGIYPHWWRYRAPSAEAAERRPDQDSLHLYVE